MEREVDRGRTSRETLEEEVSERASSEPDDKQDDPLTPSKSYDVVKEIFLIRKASDHASFSARSVSASYVSGGGWTDGASRLAQGIGVDTKKYIEGLLSLNR